MGVLVHILDHTKTCENSTLDLDLAPNATIADLQSELQTREGLDSKDYRLCYKKETHKEALDEDEIIADIVQANDGMFLVEVEKLNFWKPNVEIRCENDDLVGNVAVLVGAPKNY